MLDFVAEIGIPEAPISYKYTAILHVIFPLFRLLVLVPLFAALSFPRVKFVPASEADQVSEAPPVEGSSLLAHPASSQLASQGLTADGGNGHGAYGTFSSGRSTAPTDQTPRTNTPAPSEIQVCSLMLVAILFRLTCPPSP